MHWQPLIEDEMTEQGESWVDVESVAGELVGDPERQIPRFTVWTHDRVYFPAGYDGSYRVTSVPRNPSGEATYSVGG